MRLGIKPGDKCSRRRRVEKVTFSNHKYPAIYIRRVPDNTAIEEHVAPYRIMATPAAAALPLLPSSASLSSTSSAEIAPMSSSSRTSLLVRDPHRWLEDSTSVRTAAWIEAQQEFTNAYLQKLLDKESLFAFQQRIREFSHYQDRGMMFQRGANFFYYSRYQSHQIRLGPGEQQQPNQYTMYVTSDLNLDGDVLLDPAALVDVRGRHEAPESLLVRGPNPNPNPNPNHEAPESLLVRGTWVSNDGLFLVYGYTTAQSGPWITLRVRDCQTGRDSPEEVDLITNVCHAATTSVEWLDRTSGFFYSCYSAPPDAHGILPSSAKHRVCFHRLGSRQSQDLVVYEEGLASHFLGDDALSPNKDDVSGCTPAVGAVSPESIETAQSEAGGAVKLPMPVLGDEQDADDNSDTDSGLGSDTWNELNEEEEKCDGIGYVEWKGRRESYRPRVSVDGRYLFIEIFLDGNDADKGVDSMLPDSVRSSHSNKLYYFDLSSFHGESSRALGQCVKLIDVFDSRWEYVANIEEDLWIRTNYLAPNFRIMRISLPDLEIFESVSKRYLAGVLHSIWMYALEWIPESVDCSLLETAGIAAHTVLVLKYRRDASYTVLLYDLTQTLEVSSQRHIAELPNIRHCDIAGPCCHFQSPNIFYHSSGFSEPGCIFRTMIIRNVYSGAIELQFEPAFTTTFPAGIQLYSYETRQDFCKTKGRPLTIPAVPTFQPSTKGGIKGGSTSHSKTSYDETLYDEEGAGTGDLPLYIFASRDTSDKRPCILFVYGGFGVSVTPAFSLPLILFIKHFDAILCIVNARGGGEMGAAWREHGQGANKQMAVNDVIAAAEYLVESGYTTHEKLALMGGSCGGLIIGACITQRPELFAAVVVEDGLFDLMKHHVLSPPSAQRSVGSSLAVGGPSFPAYYIKTDDGLRSEDVEDEDVDFLPLWSAEFGSVAGASLEEATRLLRLSPLHNIRAPSLPIKASKWTSPSPSLSPSPSPFSASSARFASSAAPGKAADWKKLFPAVLLVARTSR